MEKLATQMNLKSSNSYDVITNQWFATIFPVVVIKELTGLKSQIGKRLTTGYANWRYSKHPDHYRGILWNYFSPAKEGRLVQVGCKETNT